MNQESERSKRIRDLAPESGDTPSGQPETSVSPPLAKAGEFDARALAEELLNAISTEHILDLPSSEGLEVEQKVTEKFLADVYAAGQAASGAPTLTGAKDCCLTCGGTGKATPTKAAGEPLDDPETWKGLCDDVAAHGGETGKSGVPAAASASAQLSQIREQILTILDELTPDDAQVSHPVAVAYQRIGNYFNALLRSQPKAHFNDTYTDSNGCTWQCIGERSQPAGTEEK